jgi:hypothetical protein
VGILATVGYEAMVFGVAATWGATTVTPGAGPGAALPPALDAVLVATQVLPFLAISLVLTVRLPGEAPKSHLGALAAAALWLLPAGFAIVLAGVSATVGGGSAEDWLSWVSVPVMGGIVGGAIGDAWRRRSPARGAAAVWEVAAGVPLAASLLVLANDLDTRPSDAQVVAAAAGALAGALIVVLARRHIRAMPALVLGAGAMALLNWIASAGWYGSVMELHSCLAPCATLISGAVTWAIWQALARRRSAGTPRNQQVA